MNTIDAICFVSDNELAAVVGGRMNIPRPDIHPQNGVPGTTSKRKDWTDAASAIIYVETGLLAVLGVLFGD